MRKGATTDLQMNANVLAFGSPFVFILAMKEELKRHRIFHYASSSDEILGSSKADYPGTRWE